MRLLVVYLALVAYTVGAAPQGYNNQTPNSPLQLPVGGLPSGSGTAGSQRGYAGGAATAAAGIRGLEGGAGTPAAQRGYAGGVATAAAGLTGGLVDRSAFGGATGTGTGSGFNANLGFRGSAGVGNLLSGGRAGVRSGSEFGNSATGGITRNIGNSDLGGSGYGPNLGSGVFNVASGDFHDDTGSFVVIAGGPAGGLAGGPTVGGPAGGPTGGLAGGLAGGPTVGPAGNFGGLSRNTGGFEAAAQTYDDRSSQRGDRPGFGQSNRNSNQQSHGLAGNTNSSGRFNEAHNSAGRGNVAHNSAGRGNVGPNSAVRGNVAHNSAGRGNVGPNSAGRGNVGPNSVGRGNVGPNSVSRGNVGPNSAGRGNVGPNSANRNDVGPNSAGRGYVGPNSANRGNVSPNSGNRGNVGPISADRSNVNVGPNFANRVNVGSDSANSGNVGPNSVNTGNVAPNSANRGNVGPNSAGRDNSADRGIEGPTSAGRGIEGPNSSGSGQTNCPVGQIQKADGTCAQPIVSRNIFVYAAPDMPHHENQGPPTELPVPKIDYNIVFVRTPDNGGNKDPIIVPPPQQKTLVYVLSKKDTSGPKVIEVPTQPGQDPEVYYIKYKEGDNTQLPGGIDLQEVLEADADIGQVIGNDPNENGPFGLGSGTGFGATPNSLAGGFGSVSGDGSGAGVVSVGSDFGSDAINIGVGFGTGSGFSNNNLDGSYEEPNSNASAVHSGNQGVGISFGETNSIGSNSVFVNNAGISDRIDGISVSPAGQGGIFNAAGTTQPLTQTPSHLYRSP